MIIEKMIIDVGNFVHTLPFRITTSNIVKDERPHNDDDKVQMMGSPGHWTVQVWRECVLFTVRHYSRTSGSGAAINIAETTT